MFEGAMRWFKEGSMLTLRSLISEEEWTQIIEETVKYKIFVQCLKEVAIPILGDPWTEEDEWFLVQMDVAVSRIRNLDPLLVAKYDMKKIKEDYSELMRKGAERVKIMLQGIRDQQQELLHGYSQNNGKNLKASDI
jgi:hypothetical protein